MTRPTAPTHDVPPVAWRPLLAVCAALTLVLLALSTRYGYHRDELYFLAAGRRLAWGYVDQPPLTPLLARLADELAGGALPVLRLPAALAAAGTVLLVALTARELGGGRGAQLLAGAATAVSAYTLIVGHMLSTSSVDLLVWTAVGFLVTRTLRSGEDRLWLAVGAVTGVGLLNKALVAFLGLALAVGLLVGAPRRLRSPWPWLGGLLALVLWAPNLWWQARHGWPQLEMAEAIRAEEPLGGRALLLPFQLLVPSPLLAPLWIAGLVRLLRSRATRSFRPLGWTYLALLGLFLAVGGQPYYPTGWCGPLLAAGAVGAEAWLAAPGRRWVLVAGVVALSGAATGGPRVAAAARAAAGRSPVALANPDALETVGWPELVDQVEAVWWGLPQADREVAVVLTRNYGEAGALEHLGSPALPPVHSGHNSYADWGEPAPSVTTAVVVGLPESRLAQVFGRCEARGRIDNAEGVPNEERGRPLWVCREPLRPWPVLWPELRRYG